VLVRGDIHGLGVARVDDDVIYIDARAVEIHEPRPSARTVRGLVNLPVNGSEQKVLRVGRVNGELAHVATHRPRDRPTQGAVGGVLRGVDEMFGGDGGLRWQCQRGD
jgi:hypothetical protein